MIKSNVITRFAPSPTGLLHLGHAYSAMFAELEAKKHNGTFLLRMENIDTQRCKNEFEDAIKTDLEWLGVTWQEPVRRQSDNMDSYAQAIDFLDDLKLLYPCFLSRKELTSNLTAPHTSQNPNLIPQPVTNTFRLMSEKERKRRFEAGEPHVLRLKMARAIKLAGPLFWNDINKGTQHAKPEIFGDVVIARKDLPTSYHIAVTVDDAQQGVSLVTRAEDLFLVSHLHRLLQALLELPAPDYLHHPVIKDDRGQRLAKRDHSTSLQALRTAGTTSSNIRTMLGFDN